MKRKLFVGMLATVCAAVLGVCSLVGCGGGAVLEDKDNTWVVHGNNQLVDGTENGWGDKSNALYESTSMTAISLKEVKTISADVSKALDGKEVKYAYKLDIMLGGLDNWDTTCMKEGKKYSTKGSMALKVAKAHLEEADNVWSTDQWIPDPKTAYAESLTPDTLFIPTWQEAKDENGFSWSDNPVCIGGAGVYTVIAVEYKLETGKPQYGIALVLKEAKTSTVGYTEVPQFIAKEHTFGVVGSITNWGNANADGSVTPDIAMTPDNASNPTKWSVEVTLAVGDEIKVRADSAWANNWGVDGENYKATEAGTYLVEISNIGKDGSATVTITKK